MATCSWALSKVGVWRRPQRQEHKNELDKDKQWRTWTDEKDNGDTEGHDRQKTVLSALTTSSSSSFRSSIWQSVTTQYFGFHTVCSSQEWPRGIQCLDGHLASRKEKRILVVISQKSRKMDWRRQEGMRRKRISGLHLWEKNCISTHAKNCFAQQMQNLNKKLGSNDYRTLSALVREMFDRIMKKTTEMDINSILLRLQRRCDVNLRKAMHMLFPMWNTIHQISHGYRDAVTPSV